MFLHRSISGLTKWTQVTAPLSARMKDRCLIVSRSLAVVAGAFPLVAAIGWYANVPALRSVYPAWPAMQPNTTVALLLAAIAIPFVGDHRPSARRFSISAALGLLVSLIGLLTLAEYLFSIDLGIDRLFVTGAMAVDLGAGRPSPQTAVNCILLGAGIVLHDVRPLPIRLGQACLLAGGANAIVALTGYVFDASRFYGFPSLDPAVGMAVHTATAFVILAIALLCTRPDDGIMSLITSRTRSGGIARQILLTGALALPLVGVATRIGVLAGWYDVHTQASLFVLVIVGLVLQTTWIAARQAEYAEYQAREAFEASEAANGRLQKALNDRRIFEALVENSSDFIGIANPDGTPIYLNPAGRRMVGLASDFPVETVAIQDCYPPDERAFVSDVILKSMREEGHWRGETRFRHWQTEQAIPVSDEHFTIRDRDSGRVLGLGTVTRDISEVKRTQEQLRQSQERLELALGGAGLGSWDWNIRTGDVAFDARWAEMRGLRLSEVPPRVETWASGIHREDWLRLQRTLADYLEGRAPHYEAEYRARTASGDWIWVLDRGKVFTRDQDGAPIRMAGTELDITQRKRLANEHRFLADVGSAMTSIVDYERTLAKVGELAVRDDVADYFIFDKVEEDGRVRRVHVTSRDGRPAYVGDALTKAGCTGPMAVALERREAVLVERLSPEALTSPNLTADDASTLAAADLQSLVAVPLLVGASVVGVISLLASSTSMRYGPDDVRLAEELARRLALAIANVRLHTETTRAVERRDNALAIVSHDLRHPVVALDMACHLLRRARIIDESSVARFADMVERSIVEMNELLDHLLDVVRIQGGTLAIDTRRTSLLDVVQPVLDRMRLQVEAKRQTLDVDVPLDLPAIVVDTPRIRQVMSNLIGNAVKFTPEGGRIRVSAAWTGGWVTISVADSGPGISPEHVARVFDWMWRAPGTRRTGAGLGLAIARAITEAHGGTISVESEPGKGGVFAVSLPTADEPVSRLQDTARRSLAACES